MPNVNGTPDFLYQTLEGFYAYCALRAAFAFRIFSRLPATANALADGLGKDPAIVEKLLDCLCVLGLAAKDGEDYRNTPLAELYGPEDSPLCQRVLFEQTHDTFARIFLEQAPHLSPAPGGGKYGGGDADRNNRAGIAFALPATVTQVADLIADLEPFATAKRFLDLGAGHGLFAMEVAQRKPDLEVVAFDLPQVVENTRAIARERGMENRLAYQGGDMLQSGDIKGTYDIIFASDSISPARNDLPAFLSMLHEKLEPGGALILRNNEIAVNPAESRTNVLIDLGAALAGYGDYMFRVGELPTALAQAGFARVDSTPLKHLTHYYAVHVAYN